MRFKRTLCLFIILFPILGILTGCGSIPGMGGSGGTGGSGGYETKETETTAPLEDAGSFKIGIKGARRITIDKDHKVIQAKLDYTIKGIFIDDIIITGAKLNGIYSDSSLKDSIIQVEFKQHTTVIYLEIIANDATKIWELQLESDNTYSYLLDIKVDGLKTVYFKNEEFKPFKLEFIYNNTKFNYEVNKSHLISFSTAKVGIFKASFSSNEQYEGEDIYNAYDFIYEVIEKKGELVATNVISYDNYYINDEFKGATLELVYSSGYKEYIELTKDNIEGFNTKAPGKKSFNVSYDSYKATLNIEVNDKLSYMPVDMKTIYKLNEDFTPFKMIDSKNNIIDINKDMVEGFNTKTLGMNELIININDTKIKLLINVINDFNSPIIVEPTPLNIDKVKELLKETLALDIAINENISLDKAYIKADGRLNDNKLIESYKLKLEAYSLGDSDLDKLISYFKLYNPRLSQIEGLNNLNSLNDLFKLSSSDLIVAKDSIRDLFKILNDNTIALILGSNIYKIDNNDKINEFDYENYVMNKISLKDFIDSFNDPTLSLDIFTFINEFKEDNNKLYNSALALKDLVLRLTEIDNYSLNNLYNLANGNITLDGVKELSNLLNNIYRNNKNISYLDYLLIRHTSNYTEFNSYIDNEVILNSHTFIRNNIDNIINFLASFDINDINSIRDLANLRRLKDTSLAGDSIRIIIKLAEFINNIIANKTDYGLKELMYLLTDFNMSYSELTSLIANVSLINKDDTIKNNIYDYIIANSFKPIFRLKIDTYRKIDNTLVVFNDKSEELPYRVTDNLRLESLYPDFIRTDDIDKVIKPESIHEIANSKGLIILTAKCYNIYLRIPVYIMDEDDINRVIIDSNTIPGVVVGDKDFYRPVDNNSLEYSEYNLEATMKGYILFNNGLSLYMPFDLIPRYGFEYKAISNDKLIASYKLKNQNINIPLHLDNEARNKVTGVAIDGIRNNKTTIRNDYNDLELQIGFEGYNRIENYNLNIDSSALGPTAVNGSINGRSYSFNLNILDNKHKDEIIGISRINGIVEGYVNETIFDEEVSVDFITYGGVKYLHGPDLRNYFNNQFDDIASFNAYYEYKYDNDHMLMDWNLILEVIDSYSNIVHRYRFNRESVLVTKDSYENDISGQVNRYTNNIWEISDSELEGISKLSDNEIIEMAKSKMNPIAYEFIYRRELYKTDDLISFMREHNIPINYSVRKDNDEIHITISKYVPNYSLIFVSKSHNRAHIDLDGGSLNKPLLVNNGSISNEALINYLINNLVGAKFYYIYTIEEATKDGLSEFLNDPATEVVLSHHSINIKYRNNNAGIISINPIDLVYGVKYKHEFILGKSKITKDDLILAHEKGFFSIEIAGLDVTLDKEVLDSLVIQLRRNPKDCYLMLYYNYSGFEIEGRIDTLYRDFSDGSFEGLSIPDLIVDDINNITIADIINNGGLRYGRSYVIGLDSEAILKGMSVVKVDDMYALKDSSGNILNLRFRACQRGDQYKLKRIQISFNYEKYIKSDVNGPLLYANSDASDEVVISRILESIDSIYGYTMLDRGDYVDKNKINFTLTRDTYQNTCTLSYKIDYASGSIAFRLIGDKYTIRDIGIIPYQNASLNTRNPSKDDIISVIDYIVIRYMYEDSKTIADKAEILANMEIVSLTNEFNNMLGIELRLYGSFAFFTISVRA